MAEEDQPSKGAKADEKAPTSTSKVSATKRRTKPKRAAPTRHKPGEAQTTAPAVKSAPSLGKAEIEAAAQQAAERAERRNRTELATALSEGGRTVAAKSWKDMIQGVDAMAAAEAVAKLGRVVALAGAKDVLEGTKVLAASQDIACQSLAMGALSDEDLDLGLALAGIAGQLRAVTGVVDSLGTSVVAGFLDNKTEQLKQLAETVILRAGAAGSLSSMLAQTSKAVAELGEAEVAEGEAQLAVSEERAEESEELAGEGLGLMLMGMAEAVQAHDLQEEADEILAEGGAESVEGAEAAG